SGMKRRATGRVGGGEGAHVMFGIRRIGIGSVIVLSLFGCGPDDGPQPVDPFASPPPPAPTPEPKRLAAAIDGAGGIESTTSGVGLDCTRDDTTGLQSGSCVVETSMDDVWVSAVPAP